MSLPLIQVFVESDHATDPTTVHTFTCPAEALAFCEEEVMWESCVHVSCPAIGFDEDGSFQ